MLMFNGCTKLSSIDMRNFDFSGINSAQNAFRYAPVTVRIIVKDCEQYNLFETKVGSMSGLRTVNNENCSA